MASVASLIVLADFLKMVSLQQLRWASYLVQRAGGSPFDVPRVAEGLEWAHNSLHRLSLDNIKHIATLLNKDVQKFRTIEIQHMSPVSMIEPHLNQLLEAWEAGTCDARHFYWEFCAIHPFGGNVNVAVGYILFNWCNRTTGRPMFPPSYGMQGEIDASGSS